MPGRQAEAARFCELLTALAVDPAGWRGDAGSACVGFLAEVLERKAARLDADRGAGVVGADVVAEAVLVISGPAGTDLGQKNIGRIQAMDSPLGYVIGAVSRNLDREVLAGVMGVGARQVGPGTRAVVSTDAVQGDEVVPLNRWETTAAWARGASEESVAASRLFVDVLATRFGVRPTVTRAAMELAADVAVDGEVRSAGATPATTRRRIERFTTVAGATGGLALRRDQVAAIAGLLFGSLRHPEWSLYGACARAVVDGAPLHVSLWHAERARTVAARVASTPRAVGRGVQPALFEGASFSAGRGLRSA
ncbi:hypothetical protein [Brachybacterium nesterenkovii]|uniref:hypothetical protein n=1 Tax=Brachybacterium nesterenkovii TaxID=47847 RepID=UPI00321B864D